MKFTNNLASMPDLPRPISFAIGTFDGVHLGHRYLIKEMKKFGTAVVFTFPNHPREVLNPEVQIPCLTPGEYKIQLLEEAGVDLCLMQDFSLDMAGMTYNLFLEEIHTAFPFEHIFFGENDVVGKNREGTKDKIVELGRELGFTAHYLPKLIIDQDTVSSSLIRKLLAKGEFKRAEKLLGRRFAARTTLENPFIDPQLIKPSHYKFLICAENRVYEHNGKVDNEGVISFDRLPPFNPKESVTIIFEKDHTL